MDTDVCVHAPAQCHEGVLVAVLVFVTLHGIAFGCNPASTKALARSGGGGRHVTRGLEVMRVTIRQLRCRQSSVKGGAHLPARGSRLLRARSRAHHRPEKGWGDATGRWRGQYGRVQRCVSAALTHSMPSPRSRSGARGSCGTRTPPAA